jgi:signal transduction histidine kinase
MPDAIAASRTKPAELMRAAETALAAHLSVVRHDLRSPVQAMLGYLELLEDERHGPLTDRQRRYLGNALAASRDLLGRMDAAVDLCRVGTTELEVRSDSLAVSDWLEPACRFAAGEADRRSVTVELAVSAECPRIVGDRWLLTRVAYHLVTELIRLAPAGNGVTVTATKDDGGAAIAFTAPIRSDGDHGQFATFEGGDDPGSAGPVSALRFCRAVVQLHGGTPRVQAGPGEGSLTFVLPGES